MTPRPALCLALTLLAAPALAAPPAETPETAPTATPEPPRRAVGFYVGGGPRAQVTTAIDLAALAGSDAFGEGDDTSPLALGFAFGGGLVLGDWELGAQALLALGGLNLSRVEERYFDAEPQPLGSMLTASLEGAARHLWRLAPDFELAAGLGAGYLLMSAASPAGSAFFRAITVGPEVGARYRLHGRRGAGGGWIGVAFDGRLLLPVVAEARGGGAAKFELDGIGDATWLGGGGVSYRFDWR